MEWDSGNSAPDIPQPVSQMGHVNDMVLHMPRSLPLHPSVLGYVRSALSPIVSDSSSLMLYSASGPKGWIIQSNASLQLQGPQHVRPFN